jgi:hypothetical protein
MKRTAEEVAVELLKCAVGWEPSARLLGTVTAAEIATVAAHHILTCPSCGAEAWVNIDCELCCAVAALGGDDDSLSSDIAETFAKDCRCCPSCGSVPCDGLLAGGMCDETCRCGERRDAGPNDLEDES